MRGLGVRPGKQIKVNYAPMQRTFRIIKLIFFGISILLCLAIPVAGLVSTATSWEGICYGFTDGQHGSVGDRWEQVSELGGFARADEQHVARIEISRTGETLDDEWSAIDLLASHDVIQRPTEGIWTEDGHDDGSTVIGKSLGRPLDELREVVEEGPEGRRRMNVRREVLRYEDNQDRRPARRPEYLEQMQELKRILSSSLDRMAREFRELRGRMEVQERELRRLREENERLRRQLQERSRQERVRGREVRERREVEDRGENREREVRDRPRERDEGRAREERSMSEREVALHQLEVMRIALHGLREAERGDAVEMLNLAIRAREMMLEGRRDEEAQRVRERAPNRQQLVEILSMASKLWREFDNADKSVAVGRLAEQLGSRLRQDREQEQPEVRRRRIEGREEK